MKLAAPFSSERTIIGHGVYLIAMALLLFFAPGALRLASRELWGRKAA